MAAFLLINHFLAFALFFSFLFQNATDAEATSLFSISGFGEDSKFESFIGLYGDAKVVNGGLAVQLTGPVNSSAGRVMYKEPIKLVEGKPKKIVSFSTRFSFSMSTDNGDGLAFVLVPTSFNAKVFDASPSGLHNGSAKQKFKAAAVIFKLFRSAEYDNLVKIHVGIDVGSMVSSELSNASGSYFYLNHGQKVQAWIDYEAGSRSLEVRLAPDGDLRPSVSLLSYPVNISQVWEKKEVLVGLISSNGNSSFQTCLLYSWSFALKILPNWMHSQPLNPKSIAETSKPVAVTQTKECLRRVLAAMIFGTGCGALAAFVVLYLWTVFGNRRPVVPEEYAVQPVDIKYKKVKVILDKAIEDGKKVEA